MKVRRFVVTVGVLGVAASVLAQVPRREGRWEVTIEIQMGGVSLPPQIITQCISREEAADPQKMMPRAGRSESPDQNDCVVRDRKVEDGKISWTVACERQRMTGEFVDAGDAYTGMTRTNVGGRDMTTKYTGKRLGDCVVPLISR